jgi:hypothetical protein
LRGSGWQPPAQTAAAEQVEGVPVGQHSVVGVDDPAEQLAGGRAEPWIGREGQEVISSASSQPPGSKAAAIWASPSCGSASQASCSRACTRLKRAPGMGVTDDVVGTYLQAGVIQGTQDGGAPVGGQRKPSGATRPASQAATEPPPYPPPGTATRGRRRAPSAR